MALRTFARITAKSAGKLLLGDTMQKKEKKERKRVEIEIAVQSVGGAPEDSFDLINKYGTYEIQPTADTVNLFPTIGQGFPQSGVVPLTRADEPPGGAPKAEDEEQE